MEGGKFLSDESSYSEDYASKSEVSDQELVSEANISPSVHEFLKQSNEIQEEIKKLSVLCQQISPQKEDFEVRSFDEEEMDWSEQIETSQSEGVWDEINKLLEKHGFGVINLYQDENYQESPDLNSVADTFIEVLTEYSNLSRNYKDTEEQVRQLKEHNSYLSQNLQSAKSQDLHSHNKLLEEQIAKTKQMCKDKDNQIKKLKNQLHLESVSLNFKSEKKVSIFSAFMGRDYDPSRTSDSKVMGIIMMYEDQKKKLSEDLESLRSETNEFQNYFQDLNKKNQELSSQVESLHSQNHQMKTHLDSLTQKPEILTKVIEELQLKSEHEILPALKKMQQVMLALPSVEEFVKGVCENLIEEGASMEEVVPRVTFLKEFRNHICNSLGETSAEHIVKLVSAVRHFTRLFQVSENQNLVPIIENIFLFVHEMKVFLGYARKALSMQEAPMKDLLGTCMKRLQSCV